MSEKPESNNEMNEVILSDDQGNEETYKILFTFDSDDYGKSYVFLYPKDAEDSEEIEVQAFSFSPDENGDVDAGELDPIEDPEEWDMVQEVLNTFTTDDDQDI
ncbi:DUF1292 domain-containing protein [Companilactobacillus mishanensis]|uniref:UPF0473 protein FHL02_07675 n=1 Tax=Companilactobacillus mishanensis TaxID=2486008 RepID=A0A5P0ZJQ8_9LACO|nr:DUF1292 domain-containing protein [Companilactobacillus mishanensis]MQS44783.1 DUF1292 domain-containing protein [Companilactobacillus mishanensis]MQS52897.1 DUF1292 domain-containing protein [Companilactobacillus mishanensis]MQS89298.1 DUF1292 domain-containing protein [Companilactobacillus mishanensis]